MKEKHTIGEWMELVQNWERQCEHGSPTKICKTCTGALHPALSATVRHLHRVLRNAGHGPGIGTAFRISMETDGLFQTINEALGDLLHAEETVPSDAHPEPEIAERELVDVHIIACNVRDLVTKFEALGMPDIRTHEIVTGIRHLDTMNS